MDTRNGSIISHKDYEKLAKSEKQFFIDISQETLLKQFENEEIEVEQKLSKGSMRNKPCPCGSSKKFKKCCLKNFV